MSMSGKSVCTVSFFYEKAPLSSVPLFKERVSASASRDSRPTAAEARRRLKLWGSQLDMADELEREPPLFARVEEQEMFEGEEVETEPSQSSCTAYERVIGGYGS